MHIEKTKVVSIKEIKNGIYLIEVNAPSIAAAGKPGQFCNIKVSETDFPLLRRPFSICDVEGSSVFFMFDIHGEGTKILSHKKVGDELDILGPLGKGFGFDGNYETAIIVAGGLGSAPFPFLLKNLPSGKKNICYVGGRNKNFVITYGMKNTLSATDDGSEGFNGNVIELLKSEENKYDLNRIRVFACGPNPMLKALQEYAIKKNIDCQISVESAMACGFGICQGCPIDKYDGDGYYLICKDGPVFNAKAVKL